MAKKSNTKTTERCGLAVRRYSPNFFFKKIGKKKALYFFVEIFANFVEGVRRLFGVKSLYEVGGFSD